MRGAKRRRCGGMAFTPDGKSLLYTTTERSNIWMRPLAGGGEPKKVTNFSDLDTARFALSPDGKTFALCRGAAIRDAVLITNFQVERRCSVLGLPAVARHQRQRAKVGVRYSGSQGAYGESGSSHSNVNSISIASNGSARLLPWPPGPSERPEASRRRAKARRLRYSAHGASVG
jgi:hypothetical protein